MSFLLRNRGNSGKGRFPPRASSASRVLPTDRSSTYGTNQTKGSTSGIQSGNQIMIQRHVSESQRTQESRQTQQTENMASQDQEAQGVISMTEVLADLRVLEQQQKDAERKLKNARVIKGQRLEQQQALQCKLERLKYTNGELRAQLRQSRELLSTGTRSLGARRLLTDKAGGDIRDFEKILKRGLQSARVNAAIRRKIDSVFIQLESQLSTLSRLKTDAKGKLSKLQAAMKAERRKEENLRMSIQGEVARVQQCASDIANVRAQNIEAEKELLDAQNVEESTRTQAEALADQMASEKKQMDEQMSNLSSQVVVQTKRAEDIANQNELAMRDLDQRIIELREARVRQHTASAHENDAEKFDREEVESSIASCRAQANSHGDTNAALQKKIEEMRATIQKNLEVSAANRKTSEALSCSAAAILASEKSRSEELDAFDSELDLERKAADKLKASAKELQETRSRTLGDHNRMVLECEKALEQARREIDSTKSALDNENVQIDGGKSAWENEKADILGRLEEARNNFKAAEATLNRLDARLKNLEDDGESRLRQELLAIEEKKAMDCRVFESQVSSIIKKFPKLQYVVSEFAYDTNADLKAHMHDALGPIKAELRSIIQDAKAAYQRKEEERKESRRKSDATAKELKRKDEERRRSRERIQAELKRKEDEDHDMVDDGKLGGSKSQTIPSAAGSQSLRSGTSSRGRKGAAFFDPQTQDDLSEEETPAQPKSLLSSFSHVRGASRKPPQIDLTPNSDKRVHWKEDAFEGEAEGDIVEDDPGRKPARKAKQYGTTKRGLAAISRSKKENESKLSIQDILDAGSENDSSSLDEPTEQPPVKATKMKSDATIAHDAKVHALESEAPPKKAPRAGVTATKRSTYDQIRDLSKSAEKLSDHAGKNDDSLSQRGPSVPHPGRQARHDQRHDARQNRPSESFGTRKAQKENRSVKSNDQRNAALSGGVLAQANGSDYVNRKERPASRESMEKLGRSNPRGSSKSAVHVPSTKGSSRSVASDSTRVSHRSKGAGSVASGRSASKSVASQISRASGRSTSSKRSTGDGSKKRKSHEQPHSSGQASGLSSCEGALKPRRRKKTNASHTSSMNLADDPYSFAF